MTILTAMTALLPLPSAFSAPIQTVEVQLADNTGGTSQVLLTKMGESMQVVAEQLFLNKDSQRVQTAAKEYQRLLGEVGERVFTGYEVQHTELELGENTIITMQVQPWSSTIDRVAVDLQFSGVDPETAQLLYQAMPDLTKDLEATIKGASTEVGDWAGGVLRRIVRNEVETKLPQFKAAVDLLQQEQTTNVQVIVYPVGAIVTNVKYEMHSESIPNILLMDVKYRYLGEANKLRGLPVEYVRAHKAELEAMLTKKLMKEKVMRLLQLKPIITITPGTDMQLDINVISDKYKIYFEGYGDMGRDKDNMSGKAHIGKLFSDRDEVFAEAELVVDHVDWNYGAGYAHKWGKSTWSYKYQLKSTGSVYKLEYDINPKWRLRAERSNAKDRNEFGVRYRIHEFLSTEAVYGGNEWYLRVIGNL